MELYGDAARERSRWLYCDNCRTDTDHTLVYATRLGMNFLRSQSMEVNGEWFPCDDIWLIWECKGCHALALQEITAVTEWWADASAPFHKKKSDDIAYPPYDEEKEHGFDPEYVHPIHKKDFKHLPEKIERLYSETLVAFNLKLWVLSAMGLRSLLEGICDDKEISGNRDNLEKKIKNLAKLGIPNNMIESIHGFRFMGNTAVHELTPPQEDDLRLAIEILEDIMNYLYDLNYKLRTFGQRQQKYPRFIVGDDQISPNDPE